MKTIQYCLKTFFRHNIGRIVLIVLFSIFDFSCEDFIKTNGPKKELSPISVFSDEATAEAAVTGIYYQLWTFGYSIAHVTGLSSDEFYNQSTDLSQEQFFDNELTPDNAIIGGELWNRIYTAVYNANAVLEGLASSSIRTSVKLQLEGEARFMRAISYFYLVNLFGEVPLINATDYRINALKPRSNIIEVYDLIIDDLLQAKESLNDGYYREERVRANKSAAVALLARVYLYRESWDLAEIHASEVINNNLYSLNDNLSEVFLANSSESIFQFFPGAPEYNTFEGFYFTPLYDAVILSYTTLSEEFVNSFEFDDERFNNWIGNVSDDNQTYYFPFKYKIQSSETFEEYSTALRLGEQYLIRAEARAQLNNIQGSQDDLNTIRNRAGLANTNANDKASLLIAIEQERYKELFSEWGHRWFDLRRTGRADEILSVKTGWGHTDVLYPIPLTEILNNPKLTQNSGY